jgi:F-type H+-transporting ATPase subunit a
MKEVAFILAPREQFTVRPLGSLSILSVHRPFTNTLLYTLIGAGLIILPFFSVEKLIPTRFSLAVEAAYQTLRTLTSEQLGGARTAYLPFLFSLFFLILVTNLLGNIPYSYAVGTSLRVSRGLSLTVWIGVTVLALSIHGIKFFSYFVPAGTPLILVPLLALIELVSYIARAVSLGVRLMANLVSGHALMNIISGFLFKGFSGPISAVITLIPRGLFVAIVGLEVAVSLIQAFVFTMLTAIYINDALELH